MAKVAINGLGRIGRAALKIILDTPALELVAVNDLVPAENLAYLLKHDSVYGKYDKSVEAKDGNLVVDGRVYKLFHEKDPANLPWGKLGIRIVFECTGVFTKKDDLQKHIKAGAQKVILSAPAKDEDMGTVVHGVNEAGADMNIFSCASCTTNCIAPVVEIIGRRIGIEKAIMTTIHAYTSTQSIVDSPSKKMRRGRAGAMNFVPTSTGAAKATIRALPEYEGKFDGVAVRAPVPVGSIADIVFITKKTTSKEEVNIIFEEEAKSPRYKNIVGTTDEGFVSSDIIKNPHASVVDLEMTQVVDGNLLKVMSWYDNEWGYANQMIKEALQTEKSGTVENRRRK